MNKIKYLIIISFSLLTACQATNKIIPTKINKPHDNSLVTLPCTTDYKIFCQENWWHVFNDNILNDYMKNLMNHNHELAIATLTLQKSILNQQKNQISQKITITHQANANHQQQKSLVTGDTITNKGFDINLNASWEIDLWGKLQLQQDISNWEKNAVEADRQAVFLTLTANAVREYFNLIGINQKLIDNQQSLQFQQKQYQFSQNQLKLGFIAKADLLTVEQTLNNLQQNQLNLTNQKNDSLNNLALFSQTNMNELSSTLKNQHSLPKLPTHFKHLSANMIQYRPDIQALLWRLSISLQQVNLLQKNQYPTLILTTGANAQSPNLLDLLKVPVLNWGISLNLPTFNQKDYQHNVQIAKIDEKIATLNYQETVFKALADVQNKLTLWNNQQQNYQIILKAEQLAKQQLHYQQKRHKLGFISNKALAESQESYRQSKTAIIDSLIQQAQMLVGVYQALGNVP